MKRLLAIIPLFTMGLILFGTQTLADHPTRAIAGSKVYSREVYICEDNPRVYHKTNRCKGLRTCTSITSISEKSAGIKGLQACDICYK